MRVIDTGAGRGADSVHIERSLTEPEAFSALYDRHARDVHGYVARRLGRELADDLMAETFVVAFERRRAFDLSRPDALPWLYGIATNLIAGHRRTEARRLRAFARAGTAGGDDAEPLADRVADRVTAAALRPTLMAALAAMPARERDALLLVAWAGLGPEEAGRSLGLSPGTVRGRLHRARRRLRRALNEADPAVLGEERAS